MAVQTLASSPAPAAASYAASSPRLQPSGSGASPAGSSLGSNLGSTPGTAPGAANDMDFDIPDNSFGRLIRQLRTILGPNKGILSADVDVNKIRAAMEAYQSEEADWGQYALHDPTRAYSRNGVVDINGNANLLVLVWSPGKSSAIHDHANAHCCMKVIKGQLEELLYDVPDKEGALQPRQKTILSRDEVGYISDDIGLHKIANPLEDQILVSLHLYTPPYAALYGCSMYEAGSGRKHHVDMSKYYSWQGVLVNAKGALNC